MSDEILVNKAEAARRLSVSVRQIEVLQSEGLLAARKLGSRTLIPVAELERFAEALPAWEPRSA